MVIDRVLSAISVALSVIVGLKYFGIYDTGGLVPYDIALMGAAFLVLFQVYDYAALHIQNKRTSFMQKLIKFVIALPGIAYFLRSFFPPAAESYLAVIIAVLLFIEGIYGLH
jgi:hypothetical protein